MNHKKYLFGVVEYYRNGHYDQWLKILGLKVYGKFFKTGFPCINFLGLRFGISASSRITRAVKDAKRVLNKSYSKIIILFNHSGETSILLASVREQLKYRKDVLFIVTKAYHLQLLDIFMPDVDKIFIPELWTAHLQRDIPQKLLVENSEVCIVGPLSYFLELERIIRESKEIFDIPHFYSRYCTRQIPFENLSAKYPTPPQWALDLVEEKIKSLNIRLPFVFICNETFSNENFSDDFYQKLTKKCHLLGYDVVFNSMNLSRANMYGHTTVLSFAEAMAFAQKAECVIGIRSGLLDVLAPYAKNMIALYTDFRERGQIPRLEAKRVQVAFSLKKLPTVRPSKIHEIVFNHDSLDNDKTDGLLNKVIETLKKLT